MEKVRNYIFDLYGTLVDILTDEKDPALWEKTARWYAEHGAAYEAPELRQAYLALCEKEQASDPDPLFEIELRRVFAALFAEKGCAPREELIRETAVFFRTASTKKLRLYPWTLPLLTRLPALGARVFLLSNAQACFTVPELAGLGIGEAFDGIVLSSDAGVRKPSPRIMRRLLETYGLDPADCLMTGNDRKTDIALAAAFGMKSVYIRTATSDRRARRPWADREVTEREAEGFFLNNFPG